MTWMPHLVRGHGGEDRWVSLESSGHSRLRTAISIPFARSAGGSDGAVRLCNRRFAKGASMRPPGEPFGPFCIGEPRCFRARVAWNRRLEQREPVGLHAFAESACEDRLPDPMDPPTDRGSTGLAQP
jgi:hypothetical protein